MMMNDQFIRSYVWSGIREHFVFNQKDNRNNGLFERKKICEEKIRLSDKEVAELIGLELCESGINQINREFLTDDDCVVVMGYNVSPYYMIMIEGCWIKEK